MEDGTGLTGTRRSRDPNWPKHYFGGLNTNQDQPELTWLHGNGFLTSIRYMERTNRCFIEVWMEDGTGLTRTRRKRDPNWPKHYFGGLNTNQDQPELTWLHGNGFLTSIRNMERTNRCFI